MKTIDLQIAIMETLGLNTVIPTVTDITIKMNITGTLKVEAIVYAENQTSAVNFPVKETANYQYTEEDGWVKEVAA